MNRFAPAEVDGVLLQDLPAGLVDLWNVVPQGYTAPANALRALGQSGQQRIVQALGLLEQQAIAAVGQAVGFRPEVFARVRDLPGVDVVGDIARAALHGDLDLAQLTEHTQALVVDLLERVGASYQASSVVVNNLGAIGAIVQVVWGTIKTIVDQERAWAAYQAAARAAALDCPPVAYSAETDRVLAREAVKRLLLPTWDDLFLPIVRPYNRAGELGFTCCSLTTDGGRMIAPVGNGWGNRVQSAVGNLDNLKTDTFVPPDTYGDGLGFGCLPMCPKLPVHAALIVPNRGPEPHDAARSLPQLAGVGQIAWRLLWGRGPASYSVDGSAIADAWAEYFSLMRVQILGNKTGFGTLGGPVCDSWSIDGRRRVLGWLFERIGGVPSSALEDSSGIYMFASAWPVAAWRKFAELQEAMLERLAVAYVDARSCSPAWRARVRQAQIDLLSSDLVCQLDLSSIPDPDYRDAADQRRKQKGVVCYGVGGTSIASPRPTTATDGPSLEPLGGGAPPLPEFPDGPPLQRVAAAVDDEGSLAPLLVLGGVAGLLGLGWLVTRRSRGARRR